MKVGDLVKMKSGLYGTIVRGPYTYRLMESQDYEMEAYGMGHLAGSYGSAVDIMFMSTGKKKRFSTGDRSFIVVRDKD